MTRKIMIKHWIVCLGFCMACAVIASGANALEDTSAGRGASEDPAHKAQRLIKAQEKGEKAKKALHDVVDKGKKLATDGSKKIKAEAKKAIEKGKETTKKAGQKMKEDGRKVLKAVSDKAAEGRKKVLDPVKRQLRKIGPGKDQAPQNSGKKPQKSPEP